MRVHLNAIKALITATSQKTVHEVEAVGDLTYPYVLLGGLAENTESEVLNATRTDINDLLNVTHVGLSVDAVLNSRAIVRGALDGKSPIVTGWGTWLKRIGQTDVMVDEDVTVPSTTSHPFYAVDTYRYSANH